MPFATPTATSTLAKTRRHCLECLAGGLALWGAGLPCVAAPASPATQVTLNCTLRAPAHVVVGQPVMLAFTLRNTGPVPVDVLVWGTPFENGWFAPYVGVTRAGQALAYGGASVKRGEPGPADYLRIEPGQSRSATVDLAQAFDLRAPGDYHVRPHIVVHDLVRPPAPAPRPRDQHAGAPLACTPAQLPVKVVPPKPR